MTYSTHIDNILTNKGLRRFTMTETVVKQVDTEYKVRNTNPRYHNYKLSVPRKLLDEQGVESNQDVGFKLRVNPQGLVVFDYVLNPKDSELTRSLVVKSSGIVSLPSAVGASLEVADHIVTWELLSTEREGTFRATTSIPLTELNGDWVSLRTEQLTPTVQERPNGQRQEHFDLYFAPAESNVDWDVGATIGVQLVNHEGSLAMLLTTDEETVPERLQTTVNTTGSGSSTSDRRIYLPKDIVRALGFANREVEIVSQEEDVIIRPSE